MSQRRIFIEKLAKAIERLEEALKPEKNAVVRDSAIQRFEFTFDLAWKSLKLYLEEVEGLECRSPKVCLRLAFSVGLIENDPYWLQICAYRNLTSRTYDEELADKIYEELPKVLEYFKRLYVLIS